MKSQSFSPLILLTVLTFLASCSSNSDTVRNESVAPKSDSSAAIVPENPTPATTVNPVNTVGTTKTKQISYEVPEGHTTMTEFSTTVTDGVITAASANIASGDRESSQYNNRFTRKITSAVVGKKISELNLHSIGGASLTTRAFEQFITSSF